jgi:hypothetical protein
VLKNIRRFALIASFGAVLMAFFALSAQAASSTSTASTLPATNVNSTSAQFNGEVNTHGQKTEWQFYYGTTTRYGRSTKIQTIPAGKKKTVTVSWIIQNLQPNTTYHFTIVCYSGIGTHYVEKFKDHDKSFKTLKFRRVTRPKHHVQAAVTTRPGFTG